jgi:hypothetical protein
LGKNSFIFFVLISAVAVVPGFRYTAAEEALVQKKDGGSAVTGMAPQEKETGSPASMAKAPKAKKAPALKPKKMDGCGWGVANSIACPAKENKNNL